MAEMNRIESWKLTPLPNIDATGWSAGSPYLTHSWRRYYRSQSRLSWHRFLTIVLDVVASVTLSQDLI
jgi:hypothetical protein